MNGILLGRGGGGSSQQTRMALECGPIGSRGCGMNQVKSSQVKSSLYFNIYFYNWCCYCLQHKAICDFPSRQFYERRLRCAKNCHRYQLEDSELPANVWPGGLGSPVVFCNVVGAETTQSVMTDDASEQSKSNVVEAEHAVSKLWKVK